MSDSEFQENESDLRRSTRASKPSLKGVWWQLDTLEKTFKRCLSGWKSRCNKIEVKLSDSRDCTEIRKERDNLTECSDNVSSVYRQLMRLIEKECQTGEHVALAQDIESDISKRFESFENADSDIMKRITKHIQEIQRDDAESRSSSTSSRRSSRHTNRTNVSDRSNAASRAAELRTKLKYLDLESEAKLKLKKIQTMRELEAAEAKVDVIDRENRSEFDDLKRSLPEVNMVDTFMKEVTQEPEFDKFDEKFDNAEKFNYETRNPIVSTVKREYDDDQFRLQNSNKLFQNQSEIINPDSVVDQYVSSQASHLTNLPNAEQLVNKHNLQPALTVTYSELFPSRPISTLKSSDQTRTTPSVTQSVATKSKPISRELVSSAFDNARVHIPSRVLPSQSVKTSIVQNVPIKSAKVVSQSNQSVIQNVSKNNHTFQTISVNKPTSSQPTVSQNTALVSQSSQTTYVNQAINQGLNTSAATFVPQKTNSYDSTSNTIQVEELTKSLAEQVSLGRLPPPEPPEFLGDPLKYPAWKSAFETLIEQRKIPQNERIYYLRKYVGDSVREMIENFLVVSSDEAYEDAKQMLEKRFGDPFTIGNAFRDKLERWPKIAPRDNIGLRKYSDFLRQCLSAMKTVGTLSSLNDDRENRKMLSKLPDWIITRWGRTASQYKSENSVFPPFKVFSDFIEQESNIANDPITSLNSIKVEPSNNGNRQREPKHFNNRNSGRGFQSPTRRRNDNFQNTRSAVTTFKTDMSSETENTKHPCIIHRQSKHSINRCRGFREKSLEDRKALIKSNNICLRCCETSSHFARNCHAKIECFICKTDRHCTALHCDSETASNSTNSVRNDGEEKSSSVVQSNYRKELNVKCTEICGNFNGKSCARILPVRVFYEDQRHNSITTYAMLDDQSNQTLGKSSLFDQLVVNSETVEYSLRSCSGVTANRGRLTNGLVVEGLDESVRLKLPPVIECDNIPENRTEIPTPNIARYYPHMRDVADQILDIDPSMNLLLLIGRDLPEAHHVLEQRVGPPRSPFAQRSPLGWTIIGDVCLSGQHLPLSYNVNKTFITSSGRPTLLEPCEQVCVTQVLKPSIFEITSEDNEPGLSVEDREFTEIMDNNFRLSDEGKWTAPLPFRSSRKPLPDNYPLALHRAKSLDASLHKNDQKREHFLTFMQGILDNQHAEIAPKISPDSERWYLPLFGVYHPRKPDKVRGVFDSSAKYDGICLNDQLMQGPDLLNNLLGILIRFRKEMIGFVGDIEQMFYSFLVDENHRDYLRFLWHKDNNLEKPLITYRMRAHVFGNSPSPSIAMYGLRRIGELAEQTHGHEVKDFIINHFYVDDGLKSCASNQEAIELLKKTQDALKTYGNIRLHKFASNSKAVMEAFRSEDLAKDIVDLDFEKDIPTQRSLGLLWDLRTDTFKFSISNTDKPITRRGILSVVNSLYDPLGFISPITIAGKILLRKVVSSTIDWDEPLSGELVEEWTDWKSNLPDLETLRIPRVIVPRLSEAVSKELLIYCDASELAIAAVCYLKVTYQNSTTATGFVLGKAKLAPVSGHTIPRLELCAAVLAAGVAQLATEHLQTKLDSVKFFSDSRVVLGYINNDKKRFFVYVANRVARIRSVSDPSQWSYVRTDVNPADASTRGLKAADMYSSSWLLGPVSENSSSMSDNHDLIDPENDKEVRIYKLNIKSESTTFYGEKATKFSSFDRLIIAMTTIRKFIQRWRQSRNKNTSTRKTNEFKEVQLIRETEQMIIKEVQRTVYYDEYQCILESKPLNKNSSISRLDPFIDNDGIIRVGGRLKHSNTDIGVKNPIILPAKHHITTLLVRKYHSEVKHQGRHLTEGRIRSSGFWIVGGKRLISSIIHKCVTCRRLRKSSDYQKMADLPEERVMSGQPPFSSVGVDVFGPWEVITRRTRGGAANSKRWAALFTCLATRAVHIEVLEEMSASCFINALRRFYAIRGKVKLFRSDNGTNFVGAVNELKVNVINVNERPISNFLNNNGTSWIFNPPHSSHMGGVWERMIGVTRRILDAMLLEYGARSLTNEVRTTFLSEASAIINSRPLVSISTDPDNPLILSPSTLLTQKTDTLDTSYISDERFDQKDLLRKQWKRVQHLATIFWKRWKVEYLNTLQSRRKWNETKLNVSPGDVVLVRDKELSRNSWPLGLVIKAIESEDKLVRKVAIRIVRGETPKTLVRPVNELVVLLSE